MAEGSERGDSAGTIRVRAEGLQESLNTEAAEILAALADGAISFEEIDDEALRECVQWMGEDAFIDYLIASGAAKREVIEHAVGRLREDSKVSEPRREEGARISREGVAQMWWQRKVAWIGIAACLIVAAGVLFTVRRTWFSARPEVQEEAQIVLQWPSQLPTAATQSRVLGSQFGGLARDLPTFSTKGGTLGATGGERTHMQLGTVIVRSEGGWGSGAFISGDGWLLTNYHVVAAPAQEAAIKGTPGFAEVITGRVVEGAIKRQSGMRATLFRADPVHDLALLKIDALPAGQKELLFFRLASQFQQGEECFVVGSQGNGPAWWVRSANVSQKFDFPEDLSQMAAGAESAGSVIERNRATVIVSDARISGGDSGGPLLNASGELIGLTFATPANQSGGSVGWHIALPHIRSFVGSLPSSPEGVPFDPWTAGLPESTMLDPQPMDGDENGRIDSVLYVYGAEKGGGEQSFDPQAVTLFIDLQERNTPGKEISDLIPYGLWGMEGRGQFRFDVFITVRRSDNVLAAGYTNGSGVVSEIRLGHEGSDACNIVWRRDSSGRWQATSPTVRTPLVDDSVWGSREASRYRTIVKNFLQGSGGGKDTGSGNEDTRRGPNKM